ncbi:hypothetical protein GCM10011297_30280 [Bacterioplanes sanyensis]|uniref:DUF2252 family protein n=1 Tax=Bacterioplanes sanyensis TaxID=1249553 RepID=UPI001677419A|nr:DUF2252 family protein [Bacterioplanes sanyensis]GGY55465.1 hypothetical protein GCM10011297_30280 [Bacterioplanes sanyensis]
MIAAERMSAVMQRVDGVAPGNGLGKHQKMATSPFYLLRGSAGQFYQDLADGVISLPEALMHWPLTLVQGDCHVSNFGFFSEEGSHGDCIVFAPNDFDDACYGHAGWDLLRFATSLVLAVDHCQGTLNGDYAAPAIDASLCADDEELTQALQAFLDAYERTCRRLVKGKIDYDHALDHFGKGHLLRKAFKKARRRVCGGKDFNRKSSLAKAVDLATLRFQTRPERFERLSDAEYAEAVDAFAPYVDDTVIDVVRRLDAGTGSHNLQRYYLLVGPQKAKERDWPLCHIVEVKQQRAAAPLHAFAALHPGNRLNPAHLTAVCQRRMQRAPDLIVDELEWQGAHWLVRSRHHARVGLDPEDIACGERAVAGGLSEYARACGTSLALAHGRGDRRSQQFEQAVVNSMALIREPLMNLSLEYARQLVSDWRWLAAKETAPQPNQGANRLPEL